MDPPLVDRVRDGARRCAGQDIDKWTRAAGAQAGTSYARQTIGYRGSRTTSRLPKRSSAQARVASMAAASRSAGTFHVQENTRPSASSKIPRGRGVALLPYRRQLAEPGAEPLERLVQQRMIRRRQAHATRARPGGGLEPILQFLPRTSAGADVQEQHPSGSNDADELGDGVLPPTGSDAARDGRSLRRRPRRGTATASRRPAGPGTPDAHPTSPSASAASPRKGRDRPSGLPASCSGSAIKPVPTPISRHGWRARSSASEEVHGRAARLGGQAARLVVAIGRPVERDRIAHRSAGRSYARQMVSYSSRGSSSSGP